MIRFPLEKLKRFKVLGYVLWFNTVFFFMLYWTFPIASFQEHVQGFLAATLRQNLPGRNNVHVLIEDLALWRLSGLQLSNVQVQLQQRGSVSASPTQITLDRLRARVALLPLLLRRTSISWDLTVQKQFFSGAVSTNKEGKLMALRLRAPKADLSKINVLTSALGVGLQGKVHLNADFNLPQGKVADLWGSLTLTATQLGMGQGPLTLPKSSPLGSSLDIPAVALGNLTMQAQSSQGKLRVSKLQLTGGDAEAKITADVKLNKRLTRSKLSGKGWFYIGPALFKKQQGLEDLLELSPELQKAKNSKGRYAFKLKGTVGQPDFAFGK